ncbi:MAG: polyprenol phosphomannose-dependent alpha 1,6 mannosyltransferase MptB [Actinobacteria bacterium]|nr:polyprenol phosphomannose-dependent alpha 1,6 mannosyltransferase MptB [Actinomycetota bacterium]
MISRRLTLGTDGLTRQRAVGLAGSLLLATGGLLAGAYPQHPKDFSVSQVLELTQLATICAYGGLVLLVVAWMHLGRLVRGTSPAAARPTRRELLLTAAGWAAPLMLAPPLFSRDVYSYAAQGAMVLHGLDPYAYGPEALDSGLRDDVDRLWTATPAPYGPVFLTLAARTVWLTGERTAPAVFGLRVLALMGVLLIVHFLPRLANHLGVDPNAALWLGVLNPLVLVHLVAGAHNDALLIGLMVAGLTLVLDGLPALGVILCALALLVKAPAGLALAFCVPLWGQQLTGRLRLTRAALLTSATAAGTIAVTSAACGLGYGWLGALQTPGQVRNWLSVTTTMGQLTGLVGGWFGAGDHLDGAIAAWRGAGGLVAVAVCAVLLLRSRQIGPVAALGTALIAVVALGPVVQPWYLLWGFVLLAAASRDENVRSLVAGASAAMAMVLMPRGGALAARDIVEAILVGGVVAGVAVLVERSVAKRPRATVPTATRA